jgi:hypothetical protein
VTSGPVVVLALSRSFGLTVHHVSLRVNVRSGLAAMSSSEKVYVVVAAGITRAGDGAPR